VAHPLNSGGNNRRFLMVRSSHDVVAPSHADANKRDL
jgi:hypothetical protein